MKTCEICGKRVPNRYRESHVRFHEKRGIYLKCPRHPAYKGIRKPKSGCEICLSIWERKEGG